MRFLRRNADEAAPTAEDTPAEVTPVDPARTPAKGKPTPKRREAESKRRGPVPPPPRTQREALKRMRGNKQSKEERRAASVERRQRMMAGEDKYLLPRDRGPVKAYIRDIVDSRRNLMGLFMPLAILVFVALLVPQPQVQQYATLLTTFMLLAMVVEGVVLGRMVAKRVRAKFPDNTTRGLSIGWYSFIRASQLRRLRVPKPRVTYGAKV
ncbi:DUF3043 domain-containing protein [Actinosynnema sp. NPDC047251]|uniref:DUF3043 domain-containing protein n=1 Tax=Saccharothrix espanaensis (strain ATCC 51144 / DSM 44229 / JCM 9112 / NBRC 15066 / NRRL 15764) TaxID=1179773 RepID=K0JVU2_SACES|nr:DUF3043 domain-containing protein [Saccharothrix espanaensis]CCH28934.1 hypothetical protein BN6_16110 [Saccharothrix espanaensis DSM 44229]